MKGLGLGKERDRGRKEKDWGRGRKGIGIRGKELEREAISPYSPHSPTLD